MNLQTFDVDFAKQHGLECAVLFQAIGYWANHNRNKPDRQRDGKAWMYMSRREWLDEFSFIGEGTLRSSLQKLVSAGLVETGNYSEGMYARTTWYTLAEAGWDLWLKRPNGLAKSAKGFGENSQTITDTHSTATNSTGIPPVSPKPTKASSRANPRTSLVQFIHHAGGEFPNDLLLWARLQFEWTVERVRFERDDFSDYWTSGNAVGGGLKSDWPATWRTHCRRVSGHKGRGPQPADGKPGQGGFKRYDHVAAAVNSAMVDLYGVRYTGHGGQATQPADDACPFPDGPEAVDAVFVDAGPGDAAREAAAGGVDGSDPDSAGGSPLPLEVVSG
jgi:hypothetical protein